MKSMKPLIEDRHVLNLYSKDVLVNVQFKIGVSKENHLTLCELARIIRA
jgi:hypothetical protein